MGVFYRVFQMTLRLGDSPSAENFLAENFLIPHPYRKKNPSSRLLPPNFYFAHQRFVGPPPPLNNNFNVMTQ